jgi:uncharacterized protein
VNVEHVQSGHKGAFVHTRDGKKLGELTYSRAGTTQVIADHTWVDDSLRGQGVAGHLLDALVAWARADHLTIVPLCPYVKAQFEKNPSSYADVRSPP